MPMSLQNSPQRLAWAIESRDGIQCGLRFDRRQLTIRGRTVVQAAAYGCDIARGVRD
jgi:hypothetical protein